MTRTVPQHLYKYLPDRLDRIGDILVHNHIHFSSPVEFNDPFDCARGIRFPDPANLTKQDEDNWKKYFQHLATLANYKEAAADNAFLTGKHKNALFIAECEDEIEKGITNYGKGQGISCFTDSPSSVSMWAQYASNHRGVVIEFNSDMLKDDQGKVKSFPVEYIDTYPSLGEYLEAIHSVDPLDFPKLFFCRKSKEWEREQEWRLFTRPPNKFLDLPRCAITRIVFGFRMPPATKNLIEEWVRNRNMPIQLVDTVPSPDKFEMIMRNR